MCRPSFEWNANGEHASYDDYALMRNKWGANAVRISLKYAQKPLSIFLLIDYIILIFLFYYNFNL